jgi:iron(III) transport system permease protein
VAKRAGTSGLDPGRLWWPAIGVIGFVALPWYVVEDGVLGARWLRAYPAGDAVAPALLQAALHGRPWLWPTLLCLAAPFLVLRRSKSDPGRAAVLLAAGGLGMAWIAAQGFAIGPQGWSWKALEALAGPLARGQYGVGLGGLVVFAACLVFFCQGLAARGNFRGDSFVAASVGAVVALVAVFVFFPVSRVLVSALQDNEGAFAPGVFWAKLAAREVWGLDCLVSTLSCGVAWNTVFLGLLVGVGTTALGLAFALIVTRTAFPAKPVLRVLTVLPIITPPFVIGLAVILLFGRAGAVTTFLEWAFGIPPSRWIYGLPGVFLSQMLAFTPIAFLVLIGVVEGISPSMEEAAQTLRAGRWQTFTTVSLPLMRPGLANAFLLGFIESLADFGNPLVLGGNFNVLSTQIFFAVVGAQHDQGRAAVLSLVLLGFTLAAFWAQRRWLGRKSYATVTGKGDAGIHPPLPRRLARIVYGAALPWAAFTGIIYAMILFGGFVETWGRDHRFSLRHYVAAFAIDWTQFGLQWKGAAWNSFWTTLQISAVAAPLTAAVGLLTAYLLVRQSFVGQRAFEFGTMLSFAIPGTVIGISYILAFNVPPIELTGTGIILVICFVFRNMPVGVRAGIAAMSQIDKSLDEASLTLGAKSATTLTKVVLPLLRPAIVAALVFSFVRAMTAISAVIFLVSANYDMATSYIVGRVENGDYGLAIAYCSVLIVLMIAVVGLIQLLVGQRRLGRRAPAPIGVGSFEGTPA